MISTSGTSHALQHVAYRDAFTMSTDRKINVRLMKLQLSLKNFKKAIHVHDYFEKIKAHNSKNIKSVKFYFPNLSSYNC